ncbi:exopolyphosphatase / guanosine-5'-triphosphate,3'-diphosphate pyrophosphatase [Candidatus Nanopelagicus abundans]|jgi:exopolyphosphatase/guanosine-5'-triphosphate,3'-diphosphate pyrophosphatase|uniref:Exopolyphosphatase / guanosine-5'-triphosphate,3'-diphosphate pyrophosphatase n=1 Tax=Candidatus Nanopelagicus abundans TaxID=1884916 RepID=A0A249L5S9_9ACTN|nr:Ppx/GppA phosphatase family protein [Candidatus Nanopelagicus abundans]ASY24289.1 exopolyphosphatase / guanosine-5'-triphosphate,3'-diphosphate pyrophosphatase [Candidatus Nanopelagicus abundans]
MRLGVLDVGSNTVHLQIVDTSPGARPNPTFNYKEELKLTQYISEDNLVSDEGIEKLRSSIKRAIEQSASVQTQELLPFATSALREASNGEEIINSINKDFKIDLQVLSGEEEAKLTFLAARRWFGWSSGRLLVIDIGGGSLEMAVGVDESPEIATSLPLGAARLTKDFLRGDPYTDKSIRALRDHIENKLEQILPSLVKHQDTDRAIATSKTLRTLARLSGDWFDGSGKNITVESVRKISAKLSEMDESTRAKLPGVSENRASQIVAGAFVAESVMRNLDIKELEICPWALREGVVLKWMDWMEA